MEKYIGSALVFPIRGHTEPGITLLIDCEQLAYAIESFDKRESGNMVINVLPLKPENVTPTKTHSVKLIKII